MGDVLKFERKRPPPPAPLPGHYPHFCEDIEKQGGAFGGMWAQFPIGSVCPWCKRGEEK